LQRVLTTVVLLGLLVASAAAFAITEHLKLIKSPIYAPQVTNGVGKTSLKTFFSPACHCTTDKAVISFKLRHPDSVTVTIVDSGGRVVATLPTRSVTRNVAVKFRWSGRTTTGLAPNGATYQPQVHLSNQRWTILMPNKITIDTTPPKVLSASDGGGTLIVGRGHGIRIRYVFSEKGHASVYLGGRRVILGRPSRPRDKVKWNGKAGGKTLPPGRYVLDVAAVDAAGNETPPAERKRVVVRIRYIALDTTSIHVRPRARFTVKVRTGAPQYRWRFAGAHGTGKPGKKKLLHLQAPAHSGPYRLVVSVHGHSATATVIVGKK
jgi:hypothetical protein